MSNYVSRRGVETVASGFGLLRKGDKTESERAAAKSFKQVMIGAFAAAITVLAVGLWLLGDFMTFTHAIRWQGYVDGNVIYEYTRDLGAPRAHTFEELGIDPASVTDGESVTFFYDSRDDTFICAEPTAAHERWMTVRICVLVAAICALMLAFVLPSRMGYGLPFYRWYNEGGNM